MADFPHGFEPHNRASPVTDAWQPLWSRQTNSGVEIGFVVAACHCNSRDVLHGGVLAALSDNAMGLSLGVMLERRPSDEPLLQKTKTTGIVTTTLSLDYVGMSRVGDRIVISPRVIHVGKGSGVVDALVTSNGVTIARASAAFRVLSAGLKEESSAA